MAVPLCRFFACFVCFSAVGILWFASFSSIPPGAPGLELVPDHIVVEKSQHQLTLFSQDKQIAQFRVALARSNGPKQKENDLRTPEGHYVIDGRNPHSRFHLALHISHPNAADRKRAAAAHVDPGGDVEIHGLPPLLAFVGSAEHLLDWTAGCIALTDRDMDQVYKAVPNGTPIDIRP